MKMEQALFQWTSEVLKGYCNLLGNKRATSKGERVGFLCRQMLNRETLLPIWQQLDPLARRAVSSAYHNEGVFNARAFVAQYGELPARPVTHHGYYGYQFAPAPFDLFVIGGQIPDDLMPLLADLVLAPERFQLTGVDAPPTTVSQGRLSFNVTQAETETAGRADLLTFLQLVEQGALQWSVTNKQLTAGSVRKVYHQLMAGDFHPEPEKLTGRHVIRPFGLNVFTQNAKFVTPTGKLTRAGRQYLKTQDPELFLEAFETWAETGTFEELTRVSEVRGLNARGTSLTPPASRRAKIVEALSWCPTHTWISIKEFYRAIQIWHFDFEVEAGPWQNLYAGPYRDYGYMPHYDYWDIVNGLYIKAVLMEYLATIGALDIAYVSADTSFVKDAGRYSNQSFSLHDGLLFFRINNWGAFLLGQSDEYTPALPQQRELFVIDPELQLRILPGLLPNEQLLLEMVAEPAGDDLYRLSTEKLLTAVESGQEFDHLARFLTQNHRGALPQAVTDWLARLKHNVGVFSEGKTAIMIRLKSPAALSLVEQDATLSSLSRPLDNTTVLVLAANLKKFRQRLKALGYLLR